jgi:hypothetical protein
MRFLLLLLFLCCSTTAQAREGCWVRFFGEAYFKRPLARVVGTLFLNSVMGPGYIDAVSVRDFPRRVRSLAVGPDARLFVYAEPGFRSEVAAVGPDDKVPDVGELGFPKSVGSLKILCGR